MVPMSYRNLALFCLERGFLGSRWYAPHHIAIFIILLLAQSLIAHDPSWIFGDSELNTLVLLTL